MWKFNNIDSKEMSVIAKETDFKTKAKQNVMEIEVKGRNGNEYIPLNYEDVKLKMELQLIDISKEDNIYAWLNGEGILELDNRITKAFFYNEIPFERNVTIKTAKFNFIRSPFWYKKDDNFIPITTEVINEGTIYSEPIIRLEKNTLNSVELTINNVRFSYDFNDDDHVEIDCEKGTILYNGLIRDNQISMGYQFPNLKVGNNDIIIHSGDATVKIKRKDRWL